jgi:glutamate N-acetyltransferase/amino-acid N-acetyltransferase
MIVEDGEGATRTIDLHIRNAATPQDARKAGRAVARSQLVKTSWCGGDPNWGRLMDALGYSGAEFDPEKVDIFYDDTLAVKQGVSAGASLEQLRQVAAQKRFQITIDLNAGSQDYSLYTTDLSSEYVSFNLKE